MYHNIGLESGFNTVSVSNLKEQLLYILENYQVVSIDKYIEDLDSKNNNVLISVDDAYTSFKEYIYPLLKEYNIPAVLFVPVNKVGKHNDWDKEMLINIMSWEDMKQISADKLVTIGSHGKTHKRISHLSNDEIIKEIEESKKEIEDKLSIKVNHFSYPFGQLNDYNKFAIDHLKQTGYLSACSTRYGRKNSIKNLYNLFRIEVEPTDDIASFKKKCELRFHKKLFKRYIKEKLIKTGIIK